MGKAGAFFIFVLIVLVSFLPSFLFVYFFSQYGSPLTTYIDFMSDNAVSWWAWVIGFVSIVLLSFIWILIRMRKNPNKSISKNIISFFIILFILAILALFVFEMYLYAKFILGSDLLVKLSSDSEHIFFGDNFAENVTFKVSSAMNLFCLAECKSEFFDISNGVLIDESRFNMTSIISEYKTYSFRRNDSTQDQVLFRFHVSCKTKRTLLCYTKGEEVRRSALVTVNYGLNAEQKKTKVQYQNDFAEIFDKINRISHELNLSKTNMNIIRKYVSGDSWTNYFNSVSYNYASLNSSYQTSRDYLARNDLQTLMEKILELSYESQDVLEQAVNLNSNISFSFDTYNGMVSTLNIQRNKIIDYSRKDLDANSCSALDDLVAEFNSQFYLFNKISSMQEKQLVVNDLLDEMKKFTVSENANYSCDLKNNLNKNNLSMLSFVNFSYSPTSIVFENYSAMCCFYGKCQRCCDVNCADKNYPIIFLHGHSINRALPADYSFDTFSKIKDKLAVNGYVDAGVVLISYSAENFGILGRTNVPVIFTASYYFDSYKSDDGDVVVPSKSGGIDTYAIRLRDIINTVKERTGKNKVVIVAHSMGGLVVRRYTQIFGEDGLDKIVLVTVPNHGIEGKVEDYCSLFGPKASCSDMEKNSILINKLNEIKDSYVPIHNIIGYGCNMAGETGDGIVRNSSQYLSYASNYYVEGSCDDLKFDLLHSNILDPDKYPSAYEIILQNLNK